MKKLTFSLMICFLIVAFCLPVHAQKMPLLGEVYINYTVRSKDFARHILLKELVINLKTAKQIGLTNPNRVLERADKVIK